MLNATKCGKKERNMAKVTLDKVPPQDIDSERAVLGAMMQVEEGSVAVTKVSAILTADSFYKGSHQEIFKAIIAVTDAGERADLLTVTTRLRLTDGLKKAGDVTYLDEMIDSVPTAANVEYYANFVKDAALRRNIIFSCSELYNDGFDNTVEAEELLSNLESAALAIRKGNSRGRSFNTLREALKPTFARIQEMYDSGEDIIGLATGFHKLDKMTCGLHPGDFIIVAARPGMGKSTFVMNILQYVTKEKELPALLFTPEMSEQQVTLRWFASEAGIDLQRLRSGRLQEKDWPLLTEAAGEMYNAPLLINDTAGISLSEVRACAHEAAMEHDIALIVVDYLQLLHDRSRRYENRQQEITAISGGLKAIGRELGVPLIACSQLSRAPEGRPDKRPVLSDLRESGSLEQDADLVMGLFRAKYYDHDVKDAVSELIVLKQRNGPTGTIKMGFDPPHMRFSGLGG